VYTFHNNLTCSFGRFRSSSEATTSATIPVQPHMQEGVKMLCNACGRSTPRVGSGKLLACSNCNKVVYCSRECQRLNRVEHKPNCKADTAQHHEFYIRHDEQQVLNNLNITVHGRELLNHAHLLELQKHLAGMDVIFQQLMVDNLAARYKCRYKKFLRVGDHLGAAMALNARAVVFMCGGRLMQAKQDVDRCDAHMQQFLDGPRLDLDEAARHSLHLTCSWISLNKQSIDNQVLCNANALEWRVVRTLPMDVHACKRMLVLADNIVKEQALWENLGDWDRCWTMDMSIITIVKTFISNQNTRLGNEFDCLRVLEERTTHALQLLDNHRGDMSDNPREEQTVREIVAILG